VALGLMRVRGSEGRQLSAAGGDLVPGTVVVDPTELADPWTAASTLLHEALHLRLFDISRVHSLVVRPGRAPIPWRRGSWEIRRVSVPESTRRREEHDRQALAGADPASTGTVAEVRPSRAAA
jgi:hypothetical protein